MQTTYAAESLRLGMAGPAHGHALGFLARDLGRQEVRLAGLAEADQAAAAKHAGRFHIDRRIF